VFAENTLRLGYRADLDLEAALDLGALAVYEAGDNDPSTGGPDFVRNLYPMMVTISANGFQELAPDDIESRFRVINQRRTESGGVAGGSLR
jgi:proteasome beta subunit